MSHSVVKVTDSTENDSLLMLIGEDGTVTPDRETVESFLKSKSGSTKIQVMHINKTDSKGIDVSVDNFTYVPDHKSNSEPNQPMAADRLAHLLYCIKLDHDYTTLTSPKRPEPSLDEELAQTLSILEGTDQGELEPLTVTTVSAPTKSPKVVKTIPKSTTPRKTFIAITPSSIPSTSKIIVTSASTVIKSSLVQSAFIRPALVQPPPVQAALIEPAKVTPPPPAPPPPLEPPAPPPSLVKEEPLPALTIIAPKTKAKAKIITTQKQPRPPGRPKKAKQRIFEEIEDESDHGDDNFEKDLDESFDDEEFNLEYEDDENDSDFEIEQIQKQKIPKRGTRRQVKSDSKTPKGRKLSTGAGKVKSEKQPEKVAEKEPEVVAAPIPPPKTESEKAPEETPAAAPEKPAADEKPAQPAQSEQKQPEKKLPKKEKKPPKPIPDDFALFSTPDIIRRVGGKEPTTPVTPTSSNTSSNASISAAPLLSPTSADTPTKPGKISSENRSKSTSENLSSPVKHNRLSVDGKLLESKSPDKHPNHHRTHSESKHKDRRISVESKSKRTSLDESKLQRSSSERRKSTDHAVKPSSSQVSSSDSLAQINPEEMSVLINESDKSFQQGLSNDLNSGVNDQGNINLDNTSLDIDQSLLDNLNNDLISEDILYQVAQSLVANTELQNAIDKSLNEGNLVLDPSIQQAMESSAQNSVTPAPSNSNSVNQSLTETPQKGTQIVRPDGRIVVIPPIERPTTRSRNKKKEEEKAPLKVTHKPLDEEHVSGNELDSSGVEDEEESEDDPNKLWCICNQPHNNRFMICCDTCEEWYHGKCVNITKAMGQQMEAEGKEWICLFCKDNSLRRPQAAARRIRKASRASRASSDSASSSKKSNSEGSSSAASVPCIVCQKQSRKNSIFCSESCILTHAQGVEKVVVFERSSGTMLTGNKAPTAANLDQWLKEHPGYEVVRSAGKVTPSKSPQLTQSKLKLVKNVDNKGISLAVQKKGVNVGVLKHSPKNRDGPPLKSSVKGQSSNTKPNHKNVHLIQQKLRPEVLNANPTKSPAGQTVSPHANKPKSPRVAVVQKTGTPAKTPTKTPVVTPVKETKPANKEKLVPVKMPRARQSETTTPQPKKQENIRENVQKTLLEQLSNRLKMVDDLKVTEEELRGISNEIESQLYKCFGDTGQKYRNKYRSLIFNIKDVKNQTLWRRICQKSVNPYQLVRLSSDDLASQELALWREREAKHQLDMIKKSELELLNCNRQYVLKTHKGEQVLEDARPSDRIDTAEVITSLTEGSKSDDSKHDKDHDRKGKHGHKDRDREQRKSTKDKDIKRKRSTSRDNDKKRSRSKDHGHHSAKKRSRSRDRDRHRKSSHKSSRHKKDYISSTDKLDKKSKEILEQLVDNKIVPPLEDRLWKHVPQDDIIPAPIAESDSDHEPTSTVTIPTPPRNMDVDDFQATTPPGGKAFEKRQDVGDSEERSTSPPLPRKTADEIWRGTINMIDVAQISITAHEVSGDCTGLGTELPYNLDIVGRIAPDTVWDYIGKMKCSNSKIISMVRLNATNIEEKMPYLALYSYLSSRNRLGVVKAMNKAIKDFYILPLPSQKPIPQALLPISGPGFEECRPALLLGVIVRDKRKRPMIDVLSTPPLNTPKRTRVETPPLPVQVSEPPRSYTPPPSKDPRLKLPLPPVVPAIPTTPLPTKGDDDGDEPYSPEDSDLDSSTTVTTPPLPASVPVIQPLQPPPPLPPSLGITEAKPFDSFPAMEDLPGGIDVSAASTKDIETHLAEINKKIAESESAINSISQNLASTEIRSASMANIALPSMANIALPSNLQQILDSIKTIVPPAAETTPQVTPVEPVEESNTIPLMLPNKFSRPLTVMPPCVDLTSGIPLKLPKGKKTSLMNSPQLPDSDKSSGVLSSLSEADLIKKAAEMLGEEPDESKKDPDVVCLPDTSIPPPILPGLMAQPTIVKTLVPDSATKRLNFDLTQPPIPGLEDELS